ncbi:MAG: c-type cytochrome [Steroidobacteraceae bacterium]|nr:c-type cytochrome [Steroidobacteraceae bacterium]
MKRLMLAVLLSAALAGCSDRGGTPAVAVAPADRDAGKALAERDCRGCHGLDGRGAAPGIPHLAAQSERYLDASIEAYLEGRRTHAALRDMIGGMSEADLRNVVAYYAGLPPVDAAAGAATARFLPYEHGESLAAGCAGCHGVDGNASKPGTPTLAGQQPHYLVVAVHEYLNGVRTTDPMHALLRRLSKLDVESIALYYASQVPAARDAPAFGDAAAGEPLTAVCGGCHGSHGVSTDAATPNLAGQDAHYLVSAIKAYRKTRRHAGMEAYVAGLSQQDIENIAAFYAAQKSRPAEKGRTLVQDLIEKCDRCHGPGVENAAVAVPKIRGQDKDYLIMALRAYRDDRRESSTMHVMSLPYSDSIIEGVAAYYAAEPAR